MKRRDNQKHQRDVGTPQQWMNHATSDLNMAQLAEHRPDILPEQVCFHAQQAAEKAIKAVLLDRNIDFPLTHDIEALLSIVHQSKLSVPDEIDEAGTLTPYAVETRYPGDAEPIHPDDVAYAIQLAERVVNWALKRISSSG